MTLTGVLLFTVNDPLLPVRLTFTVYHVLTLTVKLLLASPTPLPRSYLSLMNLVKMKLLQMSKLRIPLQEIETIPDLVVSTQSRI